jgi:hypothetical protein
MNNNNAIPLDKINESKPDENSPLLRIPPLLGIPSSASDPSTYKHIRYTDIDNTDTKQDSKTNDTDRKHDSKTNDADTNTNVDTKHNNNTNDVFGMTNIEKLKSEVFQLKLTTENMEKDLTTEMNTRIGDIMKDITRISNDTNITQTDKISLITSLENNIVDIRTYYQLRINELRRDLEQKQQEVIEKQAANKGGNWDAANINTLNNWIKECNKQQFVYDSVLDKIINKSKKIKVFMLILCAIQSLISVSNLGINDSDNIYVTWTIKIVLSLISAFTYIFTQYMTLEKFEETIKSYTLYIETIGNFLSDMVTTADIKVELRPNGDQFILDNKDNYSNIFRKSPYIKQSYWMESLKEYSCYILTIGEGNDYNSRKIRAYDKYAMLDRARCNVSPLAVSPTSLTSHMVPSHTDSNGNNVAINISTNKNKNTSSKRKVITSS